MLSFLLTFIDEESDIEFFIELFNKYEKQMWYKAKEKLNDDLLAEDAVQNAFIGIAKHIKTVRSLEESHVKPYLLTAVKNAAIDLVKKQCREISVENIFYDKDIFSNDEISASDENSLIFQVLETMPQKYCDILYYHIVLGLPEKEVAATLNIKINTVRQQVFRGRKMFAERYEKELKESENK